MKTIKFVPILAVLFIFVLFFVSITSYLNQNNLNLTPPDSSAAFTCGYLDINNDLTINIVDFGQFASVYKLNCATRPSEISSFCGPTDSNLDGKINIIDFANIAQKYKVPNCGKSIITSAIPLKVMNIVYYGGQSPSATFDYKSLVNNFVSYLDEASAFRKYSNPESKPSVDAQIVKDIILNKTAPQRGTDCDQYLSKVQAGNWAASDWQTTQCWGSGTADYNAILTENQACEALNAGTIDEVWIWGFGNAGFWEANMAGPQAFWTNGTVVQNTTCKKSMHIMGFNYQAGPEFALHSFGHRVESVMTHYLWDEYNQFQPYILNTTTPACGNVHFPPNGVQDYDYGNTTFVQTDCMDWKSTRDGKKTSINCTEWDCSQYGYMKWWFQNLPGLNNGLTTLTNAPMPNWWLFISNKV